MAPAAPRGTKKQIRAPLKFGIKVRDCSPHCVLDQVLFTVVLTARCMLTSYEHNFCQLWPLSVLFVTVVHSGVGVVGSSSG